MATQCCCCLQMLVIYNKHVDGVDSIEAWNTTKILRWGDKTGNICFFLLQLNNASIALVRKCVGHMADLIWNGSMDISQNGRECARVDGGVWAYHAGCVHSNQALGGAPGGKVRGEIMEIIQTNMAMGCCHLDCNFLWNYYFWSSKIRTMRTSKFRYVHIMTTKTFFFFFPR